MELEDIINNLPEPTDKDIEQIINTINEVAPLDADMLGNKQIEVIVRGGKFGNAEGGRHLDFGTTIGLVSSIATISQCAIEAVRWGKKKIEESNSISSEIEIIIKEKLYKGFLNRDDLKDLLKEKPDLLDEIISFLK